MLVYFEAVVFVSKENTESFYKRIGEKWEYLHLKANAVDQLNI